MTTFRLRWAWVAVAALVGMTFARPATAQDLAPDLALPGIAAAAPQGGKRAEITKAVLNVSALQPGKAATAAVVLDIKPGFHAQSRTPTESYLIKFAATPQPHPALEFGEPIYPEGKIIPFNTPPQLSVYEGQVVIRIPVKVKADAPLGPTKLAGSLKFQICDDHVCYMPETAPFTIAAEIVAADKAVQPNEPKLFEDAEKTPAAPPATQRAGAGEFVVGPRDGTGGGGIESYSIPAALGLAFLIGIVFNAVPCVLPVLPLKAMGFYEVSQHNRGKSIAFGLAFSLGVVAAFATLGMLVVVLKKFTWGQIFSNPWFSSALAVVLVVMALNMFGLFTVNLPSGAYGFSPRHDTYFGNFLFGILTAALSTPCTFGLFVGLLGWALAHPPAVGLLAVITVGAGMAFPYLLLSAFPEVARRFPRTGPWPEVVKQFMGFLLLGVAVFFALGWVNRVVGTPNGWWVIFAIVVAGAGFIVARAIHYAKSPVAPAVAVAIALLMVVPGFVAARQLTVKPYHWTPYSPEALTAAKASNKIVLVEFTASWCANCHTVEALVLNRAPVQRDVDKLDVQMIKADLTTESAAGWTLLRDLGGEGIPMTVVYAPALPEPIRLVGLYNVDNLRAALARAADATKGAPPAVALR